jgi:hypothetical protein
MNGYIRFGHRLTFGQIVISELIAPTPPEPSFSDRWHQAVSTLPSEARQMVQRYHEQVFVLVVQHLALSSPVLILFIAPPLLALFVAEWLVSWIKTIIPKPIEEMDTIAVTLGEAA